MPTSSISENKPNVNNRPVSIPSNDEFNMNNNGNPGLNNVSGMANMSGSINGMQTVFWEEIYQLAKKIYMF